MPTFDNGDTGLSIRTKLNSVITKVENDGFTSKSSFVTWAATASPSPGDVVTVDGLSYEYDGVSSDDDELVGWKVLGGRSASLSELRNAVAEFNGGEGARLVAPDVALVGDSSQASWSASPAIVGLRPEGYVLSTDLIGTTSELTSDGGARVKQAIDDCMANGWGLLFNPIRDGSPWEWRYLDHTLTSDLHVHFHKDALIKPTSNFQQFATSGSTGPYVITDFDYDPVAEGKLSAMLVDTSTTPHTDTKLNQDEDFTVALNGSNYEVTLSATPGANTTLSVSSRKDALGFRETTPGNGRRLLLTGTMSFDISRYGYATASAAGSALSTINIDRFMIDTIIAKGSTASNWMADPLDRRGDAAFAPIWFEHGYVNRVESYDLNDLAIYASGGGNTNDVDDGRFLHVNSIVAERCTNAFKAVRQLGSVVVDNIHAYECSNVVLQGLTNEIPVGQDFTFNSIQARRIANRVISWADGSLGGAHFGSVEVTDWGYLPDEVTQYTNSAAVFIAQSAGVQIDYLKAAQKDFPVPPDRPVVQTSGENNYGNRILAGYIVGYDVGISETGGTTNDTGNSYTLTMKDVTTPLNVPSGSDTQYDLTLLTEDGGGSITTNRKVRKQWRRQWTTNAAGNVPPRLYLNGEAEPTHTAEKGTMLYDGAERLTVSANLQVNGANWTHTSSAQLRVKLPYGYIADSLDGEEQVLPVHAFTGIDVGGDIASDTVQITGMVADGSAYIQFRYYDHASQSGGLITGDHCPSGSTIRLAFSGTFFATET